MRATLSLIVLCLATMAAKAQQIPRTVIAEHFTNTYCSVCALANPPLFNNLSSFPQVLHIAYYPSAPYAACPLNQHNKPEADARTNFYGVYGATPRLAVGGTIVPSPWANPAIFSSQLPVTTSFSVSVTIDAKGADSVATTVSVKKVDTSSLTSLDLFGALVEDTLFVAAANGEPMSMDVFRKALWGNTSLSITAPAAVGDSLVYAVTLPVHSAWNRNRIYGMAILQRSDKYVVQAGRSALLPPATATGNMAMKSGLRIFPNPASHTITINGIERETQAIVIDAAGNAVTRTSVSSTANTIDIHTLAPGIYTVQIEGYAGKGISFIKR